MCGQGWKARSGTPGWPAACKGTGQRQRRSGPAPMPPRGSLPGRLLPQARAGCKHRTWYVTSGRSVWLITLMVESASGGRMSTSALEWRCSATDALGRSSSLRRGGGGQHGEQGRVGGRPAPSMARRLAPTRPRQHGRCGTPAIKPSLLPACLPAQPACRPVRHGSSNPHPPACACEGGLRVLPVEGGKDAHIVVGSRGGAHNPRVVVHHLQKLPNHQRHRLHTRQRQRRGTRAGAREAAAAGERQGQSGWLAGGAGSKGEPAWRRPNGRARSLFPRPAPTANGCSHWARQQPASAGGQGSGRRCQAGAPGCASPPPALAAAHSSGSSAPP